MSKKTASKVVGTGGVWEPEGWSWQDLMKAAAPGGSKAESIEKWPGLRPLFDPEFELPKSAKKVGRLMLALCYSLANYVDTKFVAFEEKRRREANDLEELKASAKHLADRSLSNEGHLSSLIEAHANHIGELRKRSEVHDTRLDFQNSVIVADGDRFKALEDRLGQLNASLGVDDLRSVVAEHEKDLAEIRANALGGLTAAGDAVSEVKRELGEVTASHYRMISELQSDIVKLRMMTETGLKEIDARLAANADNALGGGNFANWAGGQRATTNEAVAACDSRLDTLSAEVGEIGQAVAELNQRVRNVSLVAMAIEQVTGRRLDREPELYSSAVEERFNQLLERATEGVPSAEEPDPRVPGEPVVQLEKISDVDDEELKAIRLEAQRHAERLAGQPDAVMAALRRQNATGPLPPEAMPDGVSAAGLFQQALSDGPEASEAGKKLASMLKPLQDSTYWNDEGSGAFEDEAAELEGMRASRESADPTRRIEAVREKAGADDEGDSVGGLLVSGSVLEVRRAKKATLECRTCRKFVDMLLVGECESCWKGSRRE